MPAERLETGERRLTPQEKKRLAYERDHYVEAEYEHAFRRNWPRKKAKLNRKVRRRAEGLLRAVRSGPADEVMDAAEREAVTDAHVARGLSRQRVGPYKSGVVTLAQRVGRTLRERPLRAGTGTYFHRPYAADEHRRPFAAFLESMVAGRAGRSRSLARRFAALLEPDAKMEGYGWIERDRAWLQAFLRDEPAWEGRLREWIAALDRSPTRDPALDSRALNRPPPFLDHR